MANSCSAMTASADPGGFMINEIYKLDIFGGVYITTTHISLLLVSILLIGFAVVVNRKLAKAKPEDTPGGVDCRDVKQYGEGHNGRKRQKVCQLYYACVYFHIVQQHFRSVRFKTANC